MAPPPFPSSTTLPPPYKILRVPKDSPRLAALVSKSRTTRLHALQTDASSFLAQHAVEAALPLSVWHKRLVHPDITVLVCVAFSSSSSSSSPDDDEEKLLLTRDWLAVAALRNMSPLTYHSPPALQLPAPTDPGLETYWHVFDVYTVPSHRGRGLARGLVQACVATAVGSSRGVVSGDRTTAPARARVRLFMNPEKAWLVKLYEGMGFVGKGRVTLAEGFEASCMEDSVPAGTEETEEGRARWHTRFGMVMERVVGLE